MLISREPRCHPRWGTSSLCLHCWLFVGQAVALAVKGECVSKKLTCSSDANRIGNTWVAQYLPQDKCEIEIGNLPLILRQCTCILRIIEFWGGGKLAPFRGRKSIRLTGTLLWSCLPSPRAPSLRISSVNSGFCKYSCTNSWKFFIRTSSRSYCETLANNM
jgi:hypothetical protein